MGDSGYALKNYLITPLSNPQTEAEKKFQRAQIKTRNVIERIFGILKRRFPALSLGFRTKISTTLVAIVSAAVLHNLAIDLKDPFNDFELMDLGIIEQLPQLDQHDQRRNSLIRDGLIQQYFS